MADAVFYDGERARRRHVTLKVSASGIDIHDGGEWIASWPAGSVRRKSAPEGILRLTCETGPALARLDVTGSEERAAIELHCGRLDEGAEGKERTGRILLWSGLAAASIAVSVFFLLPVLAERLTPFIPPSLERRLGAAVDNQV
jgi:hypothetical protein